jgi:hypothetical protein
VKVVLVCSYLAVLQVLNVRILPFVREGLRCWALRFAYFQ